MFPDFLQDLIPDTWFSAIRGLYGSSLTDDMIIQSVSDASDFFHIDEPFGVAESDTIGVYPLNPYTVNDDILVFNYDGIPVSAIIARIYNLPIHYRNDHRSKFIS